MEINGYGPSRVRLEGAEFSQARSYEKQEKASSDKWALVDTVSSLEHEAHCYTAATYRKTSQAIQQILNEAFGRTCNGTVSLLAFGVELKQLKRELRVLTAINGDRQYGDRREKIRVLKEYDTSEYEFDNNEKVRRVVLGIVKAHIKRKEDLMRKAAEQFGIEIPISPEYATFSEVK